MNYLPYALLALGLSACAMPTSELRTRAAFDLRCAPEALELTRLEHTLYGVRGCGNQGTYLWVRGVWVADTQTAAPAPCAR